MKNLLFEDWPYVQFIFMRKSGSRFIVHLIKSTPVFFIKLYLPNYHFFSKSPYAQLSCNNKIFSVKCFSY